MKKSLVLAAVLLLITACSPSEPLSSNNEPMDTQNKDTGQETTKNVSESSDTDVVSRLDGEMPTKDGVNSPDRALAGQTDLATIYSSATLKTNMGEIKFKFYADKSPKTVNNFLNLAQKGFYDKTVFHRVISDFMIQGGDPLSKEDDWSVHGTGGPGYNFDDEFNQQPLIKGSLAMANSGPNTNGSQFFIVTKEETPWLNGKHTNFGYVVDGMDIVEKIEKQATDRRDHPLQDIMIESITLEE